MSKAKRNGGYVLVDMTGVSISNPQIGVTQHPAKPFVDIFSYAVKNDKPIYLTGLTSSTGDVEEFTISPTASSVFFTGIDGGFGTFGVYAFSFAHTPAGDEIIIFFNIP